MKTNNEQWKKELQEKFYKDFSHFNENKQGWGKICDSECEEHYTLEDVEKWVKTFIENLLTKRENEVRLEYEPKRTITKKAVRENEKTLERPKVAGKNGRST